ncbi:hypothetical protein A9P82_04230 [Arachidicoccus ginsenosidimutans]|uniref:DUF4197 domain-containing protein n=1 Tax=Arachidicoccus sp. BS20 TaxID=1850526 RepID=UPI0007F0EFD8|nr:DUF4197 domain-containing protein [Arachidicoccus sp. BS20]ANI88571.1 hypothetical protein A9P82_04230 [Arachidicoccus sp. BS20]
MKKIILLSSCLLGIAIVQTSDAQSIGSLLKSAGQKVTSSSKSKTSAGNSNLTESQAGSGVKDLLSTSLINSVTALNKPNAFWQSAYKILLPEPLHTADGVLRKLNMGSVADSAEYRMNRAAESAVAFAKPIFTDAIKQMTLTDAIGLVNGGDNSITNYFRNKTHDTLVKAFTPSIQAELDKNGSISAYSQVVSKYNAIPLVKKANPDLSNYVAGKAVDALFDQIGKQEKDIRTNPAAQTTSILKSVFGGGK